MFDSLFFGLVSAGSLLIGMFLAFKFKIGPKLLGLIMAFGVGALISSVAFELISEAYGYANELLTVLAGLICGSFVYFGADYFVDKFGGSNRKSSSKHEDDSGMAILIGTILDGIPESVVIGLSLAVGGSVSWAMIAAVFISNIPEALSSSVGLLASGWKKKRILFLWLIVVLISALSSLTGFALLGNIALTPKAFILSFAGGAILTMLADSMMPEAYKNSGKLVGIVTVLGFCVAFAFSIFE